MKRVLIVEDHPDTQSLLCDLLELEGFEVQCSPRAQGVPEAVRGMRPDLILLDVRLPDMNGLDLLDALNQDHALRAVPVLVCSGAADMIELNRHRIEANDARVLLKPFGLESLIENVRACIDQGHRSVIRDA